jgi:hypothetical protein
MNNPTQIVISASRRTDIPGFYMDWFMQQVHKGFFEVKNLYNQKVRIVPVTPEKVHTIVFWSKNFSRFLNGKFGETLQTLGFNLFFNFSINSRSDLLEPNVPALDERLGQLGDLCNRFRAEAVNWRFDPICLYQAAGAENQNNINDFNYIAKNASRLGVRRCITSFRDDYPKIQKRIANMTGFRFSDVSLESQKDIILEMENELAAKNIDLYLCCEKELLAVLPPESRISKSSCIPNDLLVKIFGGSLSLRQDTSQRIKDGCGCMVSVDIGSYREHPCYHNCLFCYANPVDKFKV